MNFCQKMRLSHCGRWVGVSLFLACLEFSGAASAQTSAPGQDFRDCPQCPEMVLVPAGTVAAGDPKDYEDEDDKAARPKITVPRPFAMGKFEVTQAQWEALMGDNPSDVKGADLPVVQITWRRVQEYIERLNTKTGKTYRLPSEVEWEYAARAGSAASYAFGEDVKHLSRYAWSKDNTAEKTQPVGKLQPNAFGLYDMHGNVWEFTQDCWGSNYTAALPADFAKDWQSSCFRVIRGGSVLNYPKHLTAFYRASVTPVNFNVNLGFRVALTLP